MLDANVARSRVEGSQRSPGVTPAPRVGELGQSSRADILR